MSVDVEVPAWLHSVGIILLFCIFMLAWEQLCASSIDDSPAIRYRLLTISFATVVFVQDLLLSIHYQEPHDHEMTLGLRIWTAFVTLIGVSVAYVFTIQSITTLYQQRTNEAKAPSWFSVPWDILTLLHVLFLLGCYVIAFSSKSMSLFPIWIYYLFQCFHIISGVSLAAVAIFDVRRKLASVIHKSKSVKKQMNSNMDVMISTQHTISAMEEHQSSHASSKKTGRIASQESDVGSTQRIVKTESEKLKAIAKAKHKLDLVLVALLLVLFTTLGSVISQVSSTDTMKEGTLKDSPNPSVISYLIHMIFDYASIAVLLAWTWRPLTACRKLEEFSVCYICCPACSPFMTTDDLYAANGNDLSHDLDEIINNDSMMQSKDKTAPNKSNSGKRDTAVVESDMGTEITAPIGDSSPPNHDESVAPQFGNYRVSDILDNKLSLDGTDGATPNLTPVHSTNDERNDDAAENRKPTVTHFHTSPVKSPPLQSNEHIHVIVIGFESVLLSIPKAFHKATAPMIEDLSPHEIVMAFGGHSKVDSLRQTLTQISHKCILVCVSEGFTNVISAILRKTEILSLFCGDVTHLLPLDAEAILLDSFHISESESESDDDDGDDDLNETQLASNMSGKSNIRKSTKKDHALQILTDFNLEQRVLGWDSELIRYTNASLTHLLLRLMQKFNCSHDELLYIDSDVSHLSYLKKINLCRTYAVKSENGIAIDELQSLYNKYFINKIF